MFKIQIILKWNMLIKYFFTPLHFQTKGGLELFLHFYVFPSLTYRQNRFSQIIVFQMLRKVQTRACTRDRFYHERDSESSTFTPNNVIRPPTSHPYSGYKNKKSQSQIRNHYMNNFTMQSKLQNHFQELKTNIQSPVLLEKVPQPFKLQISQIRSFLKNKVPEKCEQFDEILQNLVKSIRQLVREKQNCLRNLEEEKFRVQQLEERMQELEKAGRKTMIEPAKKSNQRDVMMTEQRYQQIVVENMRLGQLNTKYQEKISEMESLKQEFITPQISSRQSSNKTDTELLRCNNRISYLEIKLASSEKVENQLLQSKEAIEKELKCLKQRHEEMENEFRQANDEKNHWRERALMQKEDGEIHISRQQFLLYSLKKLRENNKNLIDRLLSVCSSEEKLHKKDLVKNPNFDYEMDFFKSIPRVYEKGKIERMFSMNEAKKNELGLELQGFALESDYQNYKKSDPFDVSALRIYRPTFFSFLQESVNPDIHSYRNKGGCSVSRIFIQVMRSIMNSKRNEFLYLEVERFSRFPEFVYSWFQRFYFNSDKNCVCSLEPFMQKPFSQENFYRDLMNVKLDQSWEIITFRELLMEELSLEELYFYLSCQTLLYSRSGITDEIQYSGDFSIIVEYSAAKAVLDVTLNDFQSWNISFLTSKLRQRVISKNGKEYIEAGFFLRCLVEYYRIERSNRYRYISKLCSEFQENSKGLKFSAFMTVINKFTEVPMSDKLRIYRDCFSLTKGEITPESIFLICNEQLIFLKYLKMKSFFRLPKITQRATKFTSSLMKEPNHPSSKFSSHEIVTIQSSDSYLLDLLRKFYGLMSDASNILKRSEETGVADLQNEISFMMKALDERNSEIGSSILKCKHFIHYFTNTINAVRKVSFHNFYELLEEQNKKRTGEFWVQFEETELVQLFIAEMIPVLDTYKKLNDLRQWKNNVYHFRVNHAAKKIQRQVKKKFIEPYLMIYNYFSNEIKEGGTSNDPLN